MGLTAIRLWRYRESVVGVTAIRLLRYCDSIVGVTAIRFLRYRGIIVGVTAVHLLHYRDIIVGVTAIHLYTILQNFVTVCVTVQDVSYNKCINILYYALRCTMSLGLDPRVY